MRGALDYLAKLGIEYFGFAGRQSLIILRNALECVVEESFADALEEFSLQFFDLVADGLQFAFVELVKHFGDRLDRNGV